MNELMESHKSIDIEESLFTDKEEYDKNNKDIPARTNPFRTILDLMDEHIDGFIINIASVGCEIPRKYLEKYFLGES